MRIEKLLIKNFKNIKENVVIDFNKDITLFVGPNGFGKTTIFDAIELALTGTISRISNAKIVDGRSTFEKAYFQNDTNSDVIIKLLLSNDNKEYITIVRWYENKLVGRNRVMSPINSLLKFKLLKDESEDFTDSSNISELEPITQDLINEFIGFYDEKHKVQEIYNLFNYIQQEDTSYYLRRSENSRKETLNFLLQIQDYQENKTKIVALKGQFNKTIEQLTTQKIRYKNIHFLDSINYHKLSLSPKREFKLNNEEIDFGQELSTDVLNSYLNEIDKIINFKENFSPVEFFKKQQKNKFKRQILDNDELLNYMIFQKIINEDLDVRTIIDNHSLLTSSNNYSYYLLEEFVNRIDFLEKQIIKKSIIRQLKEYISVGVDEINIETIGKLLNQLEVTEFIKMWLKEFTDNLNTYSTKSKTLTNSKKDYLKLINNRKEIETYFLPHDDINSQCVLCGYDWKTKKLLQEQYDNVHIIIENSMTFMEKDVSALRRKLNQDLQVLVDNIYTTENELVIVDAELMNELKLIEKNKQYSEFKQRIESVTNIKPFEFGDIDFQIYKQTKNQLEIIMKKQLFIPAELYDMFSFSNKNRESFESILLNYSVIDNDLLIDVQVQNEMFPLLVEEFNSKKENLKKNLNSILISINYDTLKSNDFDDIFNNYFDNKKEIFELCTKEELNSKKEYLKFKFEQSKSVRLSKINSRLLIIKKVYNYLDERSKELDENLKKYQHQMIHMLKLPFFLYTAKILQNYQQGMGVLLTTHDGNSNIRFLTNSYSEQDAMYQLSSGQIAVISFAFTLALNKTFKISDNLKVLAIDDPIQDMDAMNVYALIDLLRHSLPDYQIIMSTHSDSSAMFIKYKFDLMSAKEEGKVDLINAKSLFLNEKK